jgi:DNA ligase-associated metallophosphoesterase
MNPPFHHRFRQQNCWLSPERLLFWEDESTLVASDLHFGKTGHFRKAGIPVPAAVYREDLQRLVSQLQYFRPSRLLVVGDMFHSRENRELEWFLKWRNDFPDLSVELVPGNHDILQKEWYGSAGITIHANQHNIGPFSFIHDPLDPENKGAGGTRPYVFSGHLHPGIRLSGPGRQVMQFPCFYFTPSFCILPAYSRFTGLAMIRPQENDEIFAIVDRSIIRI